MTVLVRPKRAESIRRRRETPERRVAARSAPARSAKQAAQASEPGADPADDADADLDNNVGVSKSLWTNAFGTNDVRNIFLVKWTYRFLK